MVCARRILAIVGAFVAILVPHFVFAQADRAEKTKDKPPFVTVWVALPSSADLREDVLPKVPPSSNAPGLLVELAPGDERNPEVAGRVKSAFAAARAKGWRAGLTVPLMRVAVPEDPRKAEATTSDVLYPGLGAILAAASNADIVVLEVRDLDDDPRARSYVLRRVASDVRSRSPRARVALAFRSEGGAAFPARAAAIVSDLNAAFADMLGLFTDEVPSPEAFREAADKLVFGRPLFLRVAASSPDAALALAARFAPAGTPAVAAPIAPTPENLAPLASFGALLPDEAGNDTRKAEATLTGKGAIDVYRFVSGLDLGGVVLLPAVDATLQPARGPVTLELDAPSYASAEIVELSTGRKKSFDIPRTKEPPRLTLSTANGAVAVRLTAREKPASEATKAAVGVAGTHLPTAEEILARHQAWRAARDARWTRFVAKNKTSLRFRFADLNNTLDLTLAGPFFYEPGKGYDWAWSEAFFNGVRWRGKKIP
ncbi:MAG TPA: hypothetical protein VGR00_08400, partial [Thermoanaerobaculia bacterium]|nr:hypothetical protein [Thermoanaerobaculia bacterium]